MNTKTTRTQQFLSIGLKYLKALANAKQVMLTLFLLAGFAAVRAQTNVFHEDEKGYFHVVYTGTKDDRFSFRMIVENKKEEVIWVKVLNEEGDELYSDHYKGQSIEKTFLADASYAGLIFKIAVGNTRSFQTYKVNSYNKYIADIAIVKTEP